MSCISEIKLVEGKENSKKFTQQIIYNATELGEDLEEKNEELRILKYKNERLEKENSILDHKLDQIKDQNANLKKENDELREECRARVADNENLKDKILQSERENIRVLCEIKSLKKISSDAEKEIVSNRANFEICLNKKSEEIQEMKRQCLDIKKQTLSDTKSLLEMYR